MPAEIEENDRFFIFSASFERKVYDSFDGMGGFGGRDNAFGPGKEETCFEDIRLRISPSLYVAKVIEM